MACTVIGAKSLEQAAKKVNVDGHRLEKAYPRTLHWGQLHEGLLLLVGGSLTLVQTEDLGQRPAQCAVCHGTRWWINENWPACLMRLPAR